MKGSELKLILCGAAGAFFFFMMGLTAGENPLTINVAEPEPAPTVTVEAEPEARFDTGSTDAVQLPKSCRDAMKYAADVYDYVSPVSATMGEQEDITSLAHTAMVNEHLYDFNEIKQAQSALRSSLSENYMQLDAAHNNFTDGYEKCMNEIGD